MMHPNTRKKANYKNLLYWGNKLLGFFTFLLSKLENFIQNLIARKKNRMTTNDEVFCTPEEFCHTRTDDETEQHSPDGTVCAISNKLQCMDLIDCHFSDDRSRCAPGLNIIE